MKQQTSIYIYSKGGSIVCYQGNKGRIFRSCVFNSCVYSRDLHLAKLNLDKLEANQNMLNSPKVTSISLQRKTTLKWNEDGSLSSVDMARILDRLANPKLTQCELSCDYDDTFLDERNKNALSEIPSSAWLP